MLIGPAMRVFNFSIASKMAFLEAVISSCFDILNVKGWRGNSMRLEVLVDNSRLSRESSAILVCILLSLVVRGVDLQVSTAVEGTSQSSEGGENDNGLKVLVIVMALVQW
jgi:hypothetical protein